MQIVTAWLFALMIHFAPLERAETTVQLPGYEETASERSVRYEAIAESVFAVAYDPARKAVYGGKLGRARTAALLLAVAYHESGFAKDVDVGPCYRGARGSKYRTRCDSGKAACMMQIHTDGNGKTREGWTPDDLFSDRTKCFASGMESLRRAARACSKLGRDYTFASFASGSCDHRGLKGSLELLALERKFLDVTKLPGPDADLMPKTVSPAAAEIVSRIGPFASP